MDYGPFSLRDVKAQLERGSISAEHTITDTDTNDKRRVADHPLLGQMAREWTAKHMELDRQMKEEAERAKYNRAVVKMLAGIFAAVVVAGSGIGIPTIRSRDCRSRCSRCRRRRPRKRRSWGRKTARLTTRRTSILTTVATRCPPKTFRRP